MLIILKSSYSLFSIKSNWRIQKLGYSDITVEHPKKLSWIIKSKRKNDKVDSMKLSKLDLVEMIPESHLLKEDEKIFRYCDAISNCGTPLNFSPLYV